MNELKKMIETFLKTEKIDAIQFNLPTTYTESVGTVDDMSDYSLLSLSFVFFQNYKRRSFDEYFEIIEYYNIVDGEYKKIKNKTLESLNWERENKIKFNVFCKAFHEKNIDYEDREWIIDLLKYLYIQGLQETIINVNMNKLLKEPKEKKVPMKVYKIEKKYDRKNMLKRYNRPTMSLDDYADKVMESMKRFEEANKYDQIVTKEVTEDEIEKERKEDEKNDKSHFGTGNRRNFG